MVHCALFYVENRHAESRIHPDTVMVEAEHSAGGIRHMFQDAVTLEVL